MRKEIAARNLIFFGAGASKGTPNVLPESPPLGSGLFSKLTEAFTDIRGNSPNSFAVNFENDFENGMEKLWKNHSKSVPALMRDMACFFAKYKLDGTRDDYYSRIIFALQKAKKLQDYAFSTINYECLFENALKLAERNFCYGPKFQSDSNMSTLWKIHGSCNFIVKGITAKKGLIKYTSNASFHGTKINFIKPSEVPKYCAKSALYPCMSLYAPGKPNQMGRATIEAMQKNWQAYLLSVNKVIIIGVNPFPQDAHIWDYIACCPGHLYYIGDKEKFTKWASDHRRMDTYSFLGNKLECCYDDLEQVL